MRRLAHEKIPTLSVEKELWEQGYRHVLGMDEAGRGAWAGCVSVGAVMYIRDDDGLENKLYGVKDSKLLTPCQRSYWAEKIKEFAFCWAIGWASEKEIDHYGINAAVQVAALRALLGLKPLPQYMILDYFRLPFLQIPQKALIKGDRSSLTIASASILAKTWRDEEMIYLANKFPHYGFEKHKGYGTKRHYAALGKFGISPIHRLSFSPLKTFGASLKG